MTWVNRTQLAANVATVLGVPAAVWALWQGYQSLEATKISIEENKKAIQYQTAYEIQRDGRELMGEILDQKFIQLLTSDKSYDDFTQDEHEYIAPRLRRVMQFYSSISAQMSADAIPEDISQSFLAEFCSFVSLRYVSEYWDRSILGSSRNERFKGQKESCEQ